LLGPNGAGKTTTLRMIYGVTRPTSGSITVFGMDIAAERRRVRARLGVTLQQNVLIEALSPIENLRVFGRYYLLREPELSRRAQELIDFLELRSHATVPVRQLSGGLQRRLAIAQSLINAPDLLILDEPTTGLDPAVRLALWSRICDLCATGTTVLLTTHYMDEAQRLCDHVAIMSLGKVISEGAPTDLIANLLARETVEFDCAPPDEDLFLDGHSASGAPLARRTPTDDLSRRRHRARRPRAPTRSGRRALAGRPAHEFGGRVPVPDRHQPGVAAMMTDRISSRKRDQGLIRNEYDIAAPEAPFETAAEETRPPQGERLCLSFAMLLPLALRSRPLLAASRRAASNTQYGL
jgi:ABC-type multidrug transport system ATPase subunit